ncbi:MAG: hypothetical protein ABF661_07550 [Oenococcus sp.]|uniref:hypothetical protein n=1 Tax=Oenococcus sp. TaxID=1979414 RepID=UPI0039ED6542
MAIFELFLIIAAPMFKLLRLSLLESFLVLVTLHLLFFTIFQLLELIYAAVSRLKSKWTKYFPLFLDGILMFLIGIYYFHTRLSVDNYWAAQRISLLMMTIYLLTVLLIITTMTLLIRWRLPSEIEGRIKSSFIHILPKSLFLKLIGMPWIAVLRFKITSYYALISVGLVAISVYFSDWNEMLQNMLFILPLIGVVWIFYADALLNFRPLFNLYRISIYAELCAILLAVAFILLPSLLVGLMVQVTADPFFFGLGISLASLIAGFLFPKSQGNMNESLSVFLSIIMMMLLASLISIPSALYIVDGLLVLLVGYILNKEKEVKS